MARCTLRFYAGLCDFLPLEQRQRAFAFAFFGTPSVKDTVEAAGVPHTEVALILVDGESVGFTHLLRGGERVAVYPPFDKLDVNSLVKLLPELPAQRRFVLDVHLGRLARYLRLAGFDSLYSNSYADRDIVEKSVEDDRIVLTRDTGLLKHSAIKHGYWLRNTAPKEQFREIVHRFDLQPRFAPFSRCMICNGALRDVPVSSVRDRVPARVASTFGRFRACTRCERVYWPGSHYDKLAGLLEDVLQVDAETGSSHSRAGPDSV